MRAHQRLIQGSCSFLINISHISGLAMIMILCIGIEMCESRVIDSVLFERANYHPGHDSYYQLTARNVIECLLSCLTSEDETCCGFRFVNSRYGGQCFLYDKPLDSSASQAEQSYAIYLLTGNLPIRLNFTNIAKRSID